MAKVIGFNHKWVKEQQQKRRERVERAINRKMQESSPLRAAIENLLKKEADNEN